MVLPLLLHRFLFCVCAEEKSVLVVPYVNAIAIRTVDRNISIDVFFQLIGVGKYIIGLNKVARYWALDIHHWHSSKQIWLR
jgi:hypothetical protein